MDYIKDGIKKFFCANCLHKCESTEMYQKCKDSLKCNNYRYDRNDRFMLNKGHYLKNVPAHFAFFGIQAPQLVGFDFHLEMAPNFYGKKKAPVFVYHDGNYTYVKSINTIYNRINVDIFIGDYVKKFKPISKSRYASYVLTRTDVEALEL